MLGEKNKDIVVLDADLSAATKTCIFAKKFPERFFNIGISEQDMMGTAAGMALSGKIPYASTFAVFAAGRAYDQIRNSICYPNVNVKICATHAGITVGEDGATHQMLEDIGMMRALPNMTVISPSDDTQTRWAVEQISKMQGPVYMRLSRLAVPVIYDENQKFEIGKGIQTGKGTDGTVIATGVCVWEALEAKKELAQKGINIRVVSMPNLNRFLKETSEYIDEVLPVEVRKIVVEAGSSFAWNRLIFNEKYLITLDQFGSSGKKDDVYKKYGFDVESLEEKIENLLK